MAVTNFWGDDATRWQDGHMTQPPIEAYALLSDRQSGALVADGSVDWWCPPRFDSPAVFARLLGDAENGQWLVRPVSGRQTARSYRSGSFVLDTSWRCPTGEVVATDLLVGRHHHEGDTGETLVRRITCTAGSIDVEADLRLRFDYGRVRPWVRRRTDPDGLPVLHAMAGPDSLTLHGPSMKPDGFSHRGTYHLEAGQQLTWTLTWRASHDPVPPMPDVDAAIAHTIASWGDWRRAVPLTGAYGREASDSLAVLRALTVRGTGGVVAAPTTSLPELIGGERNWDYRYTWLRDSAFTIQALCSHGHHGVALHWRGWLLRAIAGDPEDLQIMYGVDGTRDLPEHTLGHLAGYRGSAPVRVGNLAYTQYQADVVGEIMLALDQLREAGVHDEDDRFAWALQVSLLELTEHRLDTPDRGIWEVRGDPQLFTHGRVMMWAAFDCGVRAVEQHGLSGPVERWRQLRDDLAGEIWAKGVRDGAFVQHYGTSEVDAALLQIPQTGFVAADSPVMLATVARIEHDLVGAHGFVQRYRTDGDDGLAGGEGAFVMCSFWLVEQYARSGRRDEAVTLMDQLLATRNDVGLLAEEYDPVAGRMLGNFPQAFSHLALIRAAQALG
ncbi:glycoside hydrolase family 15 protein [Propionibacteriaceae bacterium G57]|uniref:glycoside hydrolase family 15 protein n=1 Tax=Aestuariimicrobium sp. G57 TaxID=3418485 RepID=UPI003DA70D36